MICIFSQMDSINCFTPLSEESILLDWDDDDIIETLDESNFGSYSTPKSINVKNRRLAKAENHLDKCIIEVTQQLTQTIERPETPSSQFGNYIATVLSGMSSPDRDSAKMDSMNVLINFKNRLRTVVNDIIFL